MNNKKFYDDLISNKTNTNSLLDNLYKPIKKNKGNNRTHYFSVEKPGVFQQADTLFLSNDNGFKYCLVVVDQYDRKIDARPLKTKTASEIIKAFKEIWNGKYLTKPIRITVDAGTEFKGDVNKYFKDNNISIKTAQPGRHSQVALVEIKNLIVGKSLLKRQTGQEIITGAASTEWIEDLPHIIDAINRKAHPIKEKNNAKTPICDGEACYLLNIGDLVRVALDEPRAADESNTKLYGKFRASDIRWEIKPRKIENIILNNGQPPLYQVEGKKQVAFTRNQLQPVNPKEQLPDPKQFIRKPTYYKIEKILDKKVEKGKTLYFVKWFGYEDEDNTWESEETLKEDIPKLLKEYNESLEVKKPKKVVKNNIPKTATPVKTSKTGRIIKQNSKFKK